MIKIVQTVYEINQVQVYLDPVCVKQPGLWAASHYAKPSWTALASFPMRIFNQQIFYKLDTLTSKSFHCHNHVLFYICICPPPPPPLSPQCSSFILFSLFISPFTLILLIIVLSLLVPLFRWLHPDRVLEGSPNAFFWAWNEPLNFHIIII